MPLLVALCVVLTGAGLSPAQADARRALASATSPLTVTLQSMAPSTIPRRGTLTLTGEVTNDSEETWSDLNVYPFISYSPMTTREELALASETDPALEVGARTQKFVTVPDLAPGETQPFTLTVRRDELAINGDPGVYWIGVHVLGSSPAGRIDGADGRARTFIPLMPDGADPARYTLVLPVREKVRRTPTGRLYDPARWTAELGDDGRLSRILGLAESAGASAPSLLVDPAVLAAADAMTRENPQMDLGPSGASSTSTGSSASAGASGSPSPTENPSGSDGNAATPSTDATTAQAWLDRFKELSRSSQVFRLPYADLDVSAALRRGEPGLFSAALARSRATMERLGISSTELVAPAPGLINPVAADAIDPAVPLLVSDRAAPGATDRVLRMADNRDVVLADTAASSGGPGPTRRLDALAVRQRILADAALTSLSGDPRTLVVDMPPRWDPGANWRTADFFAGLDVPWLLPRALSTSADSADPWKGRLHYSRAARRAEVRPANLAASRRLIEIGRTLASVLSENDTVDDFLAESALMASSTFARGDSKAAIALARSTTGRVRSMLGRVHIVASSFVTMSSADGTFLVKVINDLDEPVTVSIRALVDGVPDSTRLVIANPGPRDLPAGQRVTVKLRATSRDIGVYAVTLLATTTRGEPLGNSTQLNLRTSRVGVVIWWVLGIMGGLLFLMVGYRIWQRVRSRKATQGAILTAPPHAGDLGVTPPEETAAAAPVDGEAP